MEQGNKRGNGGNGAPPSVLVFEENAALSFCVSLARDAYKGLQRLLRNNTLTHVNEYAAKCMHPQNT